MGKVTYGQSGYVGSSMSVRAVEAYESGEKPKSRWTKAAMLATLEKWCKEADRVMLPEVAKLKKPDMFACCFCCTSWHHTGKYANITEFYGVDEARADNFSRPMTDEEAAESESQHYCEHTGTLS
ncbi:hypothetical protein BHK98_09220 [Hornefia porci]|uniref:Uncharacterized protein n=2 Tax=Hornefia porci TaxID=2652292 RepID=A0A1Q9JJ33_9FIRM|nr:hypothetical protein BHK98_09220 [Hornefia porci]